MTPRYWVVPRNSYWAVIDATTLGLPAGMDAMSSICLTRRKARRLATPLNAIEERRALVKP